MALEENNPLRGGNHVMDCLPITQDLYLKVELNTRIFNDVWQHDDKMECSVLITMSLRRTRYYVYYIAYIAIW